MATTLPSYSCYVQKNSPPSEPTPGVELVVIRVLGLAEKLLPLYHYLKSAGGFAGKVLSMQS